MTCLSAVDYTFFLPFNITLKYLDTLANSKLNSASLSLLPTQCQMSLKRLVCSNIYLKCPPNFPPIFNLTNLQKHGNYHIFTDFYPSKLFLLPFERPCVSVCNSAVKDCFGILNIFNMPINCSSKTDYSYGQFGHTYGIKNVTLPYTYDMTNEGTQCSNMSAVFEVAGTMEPYLHANGGGSCSGIIGSSLYVPSGM